MTLRIKLKTINWIYHPVQSMTMKLGEWIIMKRSMRTLVNWFLFIFSVDVYSFLQAPLQSPNRNVATILKTYVNKTNETVTLTQADTAKILCALAQLENNMFSEAAERLSLPALCQFMKSLCRASREQLYRSTGTKKGKKNWWLGRPWKIKNNSLPLSLLLHRVGDVTLKVFRSSRPLLHILKVWAISGPHLMDVSHCNFRLIFLLLFLKYEYFRQRVTRSEQFRNALLSTFRT